MSFVYYLASFLLLKVHLAAHNIQYVSIGEDVQMVCPYETIIEWKKLNPPKSLVLCEKGKRIFHESLSDQITDSDCRTLTIWNFTRKDAGFYRCFSNNTHMGKYKKYEVEIILRIKPHVSIITSSQSPIRKGQMFNLICQDESGGSGDIQTFSWTHNGRKLPNYTNSLLFTNVDAKIAGEYRCNASNEAGEDSDSINVSVTYSPVVEHRLVDFYADDITRTMSFEVSGIPDTFEFSDWRHYTDTTNNNHLIRILQGNRNGTLTLPINRENYLSYEDSGVYSCKVTNGIPDEEGNLWQTGKVYVKVKGIPELAMPHEDVYIAYLNSTTHIFMNVLSSSIVKEAHWFDENNLNIYKSVCTSSVFVAEFYQTYVDVDGYTCAWQIINTKKDDFQNYSVKISNEYGSIVFHFSVVSANKKKVHFTQTGMFIVIPIVLLAAFVLFCWRLWKARTKDRNNSNAHDEVVVQPFQDDLPGPSSASHNRGDEYSSIDRRLQVSGVQTVNYKVSKNNNRKQQSEVKDGPNRIVEDDFIKLNYVEIAFDSKRSSGEFYIHGAENKTQYVDIDLLAKADPLCSEDENDSSASSRKDNDDDFVSLEEIQTWRINEDT